MFFTQEDYRKIEQYLKASGKKDTDLPPIGEMNLQEDDLITIVHNGINYKVFLRKLIAAIGPSDDSVKTVHSINVSFITDEDTSLSRFVKYSTAQEAFAAVPSKYRFPGIGITWIDTNNIWKTYQFIGTSSEEWGNIEAYIPYNLANEIHENTGLNPGDPEYIEDSAEIGVTQRLLQQKIRDINTVCSNLQTQIDALNIDKITVNLSVSPSTVFVGGTYTITLTATSSVAAQYITIKHNGADMQVGSGTSFTINATVEATASGTETYSAVFTINGVTKTVSKTLSKVNKIYYGVGTENSYSGVDTPKSIQTNANGSYTFTTTTENKYAYILVPYAMSAINLNNVKLESGFGYNLTLITDNATIDNARYRVYRSAENAANESFTVVIS